MARVAPGGGTLTELAANFGTRLRAQGERRGLTLEDVSRSTKIKASLLAALEQSDLTRWPKGIYGRAFLRAYAEAIGLSADSSLDDVLPHFRTPDDALLPAGDLDSPDAAASGSLRLTFGDEVVAPRHTAGSTIDAAVTLAGVLLVAALIGTAAEMSFLKAAAVVALVWYPLAHGLFGGFSPTRLLTKARRAPVVLSSNDPAESGRAFTEYQVTN